MRFLILSLFTFLCVNLTTPVALAAGLSPKTVDGATTVNSDKAFELFKAGTLFIDVRKNSDWEAGRVPDAIQLDVKKKFSKETLAAVADKTTPVVFYCNAHKCKRSSKATAKAVSWGYKTVYYYRDGFPAWKTAMYPTE